mmetsp:Transcript_9029/g.22765  ORF Transcript_9029/g.22765 Transcript_9029/m.22765 type:complete len:203 (+) Transcript_9029:361-969(+)
MPERRMGLQRTVAEVGDTLVAKAACSEAQGLHGLVFCEACTELALHALSVANVAAQDDVLERRARPDDAAHGLHACGPETGTGHKQDLEVFSDALARGGGAGEALQEPLRSLVADVVVGEVQLLEGGDFVLQLELLEDGADRLGAILGSALVQRRLRILDLLQVQHVHADVENLPASQRRRHAHRLDGCGDGGGHGFCFFFC